MRRGDVVLCVGLVAITTAATGRAQSSDASARPDASSTTAVQVPLTFALDLPVRARIAIIEAAADIWRDAGVDIDWRAAGGECEPARCVRAIVVRRPSPGQNAEARTVGELVRLQGGGAAVFISVDEAERIVRQAPGPPPRPGLLEGDPLGTVLGRALAHELGHYFLDTATHASRGLMRARFEPSEFADLRSSAFALDAEAVGWVRGRVTRGLPLGPSVFTMPAVVRAPSDGTNARLTFAYRH